MKCEKCGSENVEPRKTIMHSGNFHIAIRCLDCGKTATRGAYVSKTMFSPEQIAAMVVAHDYREPDHVCCVVGCYSNDVEWHHFAPRHLFGEDADNWPANWICTRHHRVWHERTRTGAYYPENNKRILSPIQ